MTHIVASTLNDQWKPEFIPYCNNCYTVAYGNEAFIRVIGELRPNLVREAEALMGPNESIWIVPNTW